MLRGEATFPNHIHQIKVTEQLKQMKKKKNSRNLKLCYSFKILTFLIH